MSDQSGNPAGGDGAGTLRDLGAEGGLRWEDAPAPAPKPAARPDGAAARIRTLLSKGGLQEANSELSKGIWTGTLAALGLDDQAEAFLGGQLDVAQVNRAVAAFATARRELESGHQAFAHLKRAASEYAQAHAWLEALTALASQDEASCAQGLGQLVLRELSSYLRAQAYKYNHDGVIDFSEWDALVKDGRRLGLNQDQVQHLALAACREARGEAQWLPPPPPRDDEARRLAHERERELEEARAHIEAERRARLEAERASQQALLNAEELNRTRQQEDRQRNVEAELKLVEAQRRAAEEQRRAAEAELRLAEASRQPPPAPPGQALSFPAPTQLQPLPWGQPQAMQPHGMPVPYPPSTYVPPMVPYVQGGMTQGGPPPREKMVTLLLALFLGGFGAHRFYTGHTAIGIAQLLTWGGCGFWTILDWALILSDRFRDAQGRPLVKR